MTPSVEPTSEAEAPAYSVPADLLGDSEIIVLAIKPSGWYLLTASLPVLIASAVAAGVAYGIGLFHPYSPREAVLSFCAAVALGRVMLACWQWIGRTYVLTNLRIVCLRGIVHVGVRAAALTEVRQAVLSAALPERVAGVGSIYCLPAAEGGVEVVWQTVARPREVHEIIDAALSRAHGPRRQN
ncbi:hypothetical protein LCGC14_1686830 [marine sediment metagenome]|uniref:DUF304 domain-containing protein n=1 Tax=marine sediment metagenome TaxID=412755 RepID=A0A0F9HM21_9ZZZZ